MLGNEEADRWQILLLQAGICGGLLISAKILEVFGIADGRLIIVIHISSMVVGGWNTARETWADIRKWQIEIHFLMLAVAVGAAFIGAWGEGALLLFLFALGGALEDFAFHRMDRAISALAESSPKMARVIQDDGNFTEVPVESITPGMKILVRPDEIFPVDAVVLSGETEVDESSLTGESLPVIKHQGDLLYSGTLNLWGKVTAKVLRPVDESSLAKIIQMIREAQQSKAPSQRFTDRFGSHYALGILSFATLMFFIWLFIFELGPNEAAYRSMSFLVVASPCALVLSIPSAILAGIAWGARHGVLFRGGRAIEELASINTIALDKTGTLTAGQMEILKVETYPPQRQKELLAIAYSIEAESNHPIARAITRHGKRKGLVPQSIENLRSLTGMGIEATIAGEKYTLGRKLMVQDDWRFQKFPQEQDQFGNTEVWLKGRSLFGRIILHDEIRYESKQVLSSLRNQGMTTLMLTGDKSSAATIVARKLGITEVHAELLPDEKVALIRAKMKEGQRVAMVGDGVNDAPSLAAAQVSISLGGRGSDAALEQANVVLLNDRIDRLPEAILLSKRARRVIRQNLALSLGTVLTMVCATLLTAVPLGLAVVIHESSTVLVCLNSLRLLWFR